MQDFQSPACKRSRAAYVAQCTIEYFITILIGSDFIARITREIGINDSLTGIISSIVSLSCLVQLGALLLARKNFNTKITLVILDTLGFGAFSLLYLIPFLPLSLALKTVLLFSCVFFGYFLKYLLQAMYFKWANSYVDPHHRAVFGATKEMISLFTGVLFTFFASFVVDRFEGLDNIRGAFLFLSIAILILNIANLVSVCLIKYEKPTSETGERRSFSDVMRNTVGNKDFRNVLILSMLWSCALYFTSGFLGSYRQTELGMSLFHIQIISNVACLARFVISRPFGRYSDKHSYAKGYRLALCLAAVMFLLLIFTTKATWFFMIAFMILNQCTLAGTNSNGLNITYSYVSAEYVTEAFAIRSAVGGLCGFLSSLLAARVLATVQANGNMLFGIHIYGQQVLALVSFVLTVITIIFIRTVIEKQKVTVQ